METVSGRTPDGDGLSSQAIEPPSGVSPVPASIPCADRTDRYDKNTTRIVCSAGWVIATIERLSNDRHAIFVGDRRYNKLTFASAAAAFKWWKARREAIAMETRSAETLGSVGEADDSAAIAQPL